MKLMPSKKCLIKVFELLKHYERLALTALEVSKASAVDVLKLQIRQNELNQEKAVLIQQYNGIQAAINSKLNRSYNTKVTIESSPEIPEEDTLYDYETLALNPELLKYDKLYQSVELSELLNQKEKKKKKKCNITYTQKKKKKKKKKKYQKKKTQKNKKKKKEQKKKHTKTKNKKRENNNKPTNTYKQTNTETEERQETSRTQQKRDTTKKIT